jgi:hypothetical protein
MQDHCQSQNFTGKNRKSPKVDWLFLNAQLQRVKTVRFIHLFDAAQMSGADN